MENTSLPSDVSNNVTTLSSEYDNLFYLFYTRDFALKVIYTVIEVLASLETCSLFLS